ncbi:MAG: hypothetical protein ACXADB_00845 [Candidatus Hermodarchaeia archaeon]
MSEIESVQRLEELYRQLMGSDIATAQEVKAKAEIISLIPQMKAVILAEDSTESQELGQELEALYEMVSKWNPLTAWFRDEEQLVQLYFDILSKVRLFLIRRKGPTEESSTLVSESLHSVRGTMTQLATVMEEIRVTVKTLLEIVSPTPEVHARIAGLSSRALELERRIADFEAATGNKTEADNEKIQRWKQDLQKLTKQIETLRKLAKKG